MRRSSVEEDASARGYTLIELLMAMALSLVVILLTGDASTDTSGC
jgi:prepilin-type N-terminal cleavage/methylation domain-containing protein